MADQIKCRVCGDVDHTQYGMGIGERMKRESLCFDCENWMGYVRDKDQPTSVRVKGHHFTINPEEPKGGLRGHAGRRFVIEFTDGRQVTSTNVWHQGEIPPRFQSELPDNARFVPQEGQVLS